MEASTCKVLHASGLPAQSSKKNKKKKSESVVLVEVMQLAEKNK